MRRIVLILLLAALALAGCGGEKVDPAALAKESADAFDQVETFHFRLAVSDGDAAPIDTGTLKLVLQTAEGDLKRPQQIQGTLKAKAEGLPLAVQMNVIILEGEAWVTNPINPSDWQPLGAESAALTAFSPAKGVSDVLRGLKDVKLQGEETIDGVETYHIVGSSEVGTLAALTGGAAGQGTVQVEAWIGVEDKRPRQMAASGALDPVEKASIRRTLYLSEFGKTVEIKAPN